MTCLWCGTLVSDSITPIDWPSDTYCSRSCAEASSRDLALWNIAAEEHDDDLASVRYWLDQDAMLDAMQDRMMENAL